ncbi:hypothetical protein MAR_009771 [Mya arenaria]|uniref:Mannosyltransferase n=1 Tax=Mya arenaria TaxID=6604 RepID=A0ABY7DZT3_MYAAR|nr:uncharacterized protein LOC128229943 [Mya arenaria]XP_052797824.1 uncharacterized protein LOC128229943 [Mya arenaria]XP_052797825.1 uncharacterized protein LOC128229943 [Mya arenaria]XP_052797826.1 uncharacterized protein LOC128229943 [Mya arenaria]XP_052797827.1 uncharacterized protein LOC128229943 [Mya arenaria]XP_052797828.1 uncharacterized protein LOC128229943 [Mya arenaria]WAR03213.1 hypothetical protein MAR_009771 [Mya arenaria]
MTRSGRTGRQADRKRLKSRVSHAAETRDTQENEKARSQQPSIGIENHDVTADIETDAGSPFSHSETSIFPRWLPWLIVMVTLSVRVHHVLQPTNWWILHPDEVFQTVEVAHTEAFQFGFRSYEYLPPPPDSMVNVSISQARAREVATGMYSLRSFILPKLLSAAILMARMAGISYTPFMVCKLVHVVITSFLPLAVFRFTVALEKSVDAGNLAAIFVSSSLVLNVLGTHTFINSFTATFDFIALGTFINILQRVEKQTDIKVAAKRRLSLYNHLPDTSHDQSGEDLSDVNGNFPKRHNNNLKRKTGYFTNKIDNFKRWIQLGRELSSGFIIAVCVYIRIDSTALSLAMVLAFIKRRSKIKKYFMCVRDYQWFFAGVFVGLVLGGFYDYLYYDSWFISPWQWVKFNTLSKSSGTVFGVSPFYYYIAELLKKEQFFIIFVVVIVVELIMKAIYNRYDGYNAITYFSESHLVFMFLLILYSSNGHKELRFLHNCIVIMYVSFASAIMFFYKMFTQSGKNQNNTQYCKLCIYTFIVLFVSSQSLCFLNMSSNEKSKWSYAGRTDSWAVNTGLHFIGRQNDVTGILLDRPLHLTAGYSIFNKDVPIFALNKYEFMEFNKEKMAYLKTFDETQHGLANYRFHTFGQIRDFVSVYNTPYLYKQLLKKVEYNYLVLEVNREFENTGGYEEVFRVGNTKVMRRTFDRKSEEKMAEVANRIPVGTNATILEYEGDWLSHFGLYDKAIERLIHSNALVPKRLGPYQLLLDVYRRTGEASYYNKVLDACSQFHQQNTCLKPYNSIQLHSEYYSFLVK